MKPIFGTLTAPMADSFKVMRQNKLATLVIVAASAAAFLADALGILAVVPIMEMLQGREIGPESNSSHNSSSI